MLPRAAQRLETTLLLSRQALPRPARLYSTPSRPAKAQGLAAVEHIRPDISYPGFLRQPSPSSRPIDEERILNSLERFLARDRTYTVLPTPQPPESELTKHGETWFSDTATQESMSIMDACLHNLYDVSRAKIIFNQLRQNAASSLLETGVYNAFIDAYFGMATQKDVENEEIWLADIYDIYDLLETEAENTAPNKMTYGLMLRVWLQ
jgi:DNA-directed RNA polymerase